MVPWLLSFVISVYSWMQYQYVWSVRPDVSEDLTIKILTAVIALLLGLIVKFDREKNFFTWLRWLLFVSNLLVLLAFCLMFTGLFILFPEP
jgi:hypothetical protein